MFSRTFSPSPQPATPSAAPSFAVQRFIQPKLTVGPVDAPVERERNEAGEGLEEKEAEELGLERVKHAFVPTLPPGRPEENAASSPVPRNGSLGSRIPRHELARQPLPKIGPPGPSPLIQTSATIGFEDEGRRELSAEVMRSAAAAGMRTPAVTLPFLGRIQASFGHHPVAHVKAHVGPEAAKSSRAMSALAFASGDHVVFGGAPNLRTAAHEAAHIVQQRAGVQLAGGIGREGDAYERHADAVADAVVAGRSVEGLLEPFVTSLGGESRSIGRPVQRSEAGSMPMPAPESGEKVKAPPATEEEIKLSVDDYLDKHSSAVVGWLGLSTHPTLGGENFVPEKLQKKEVIMASMQFAPEQPDQQEGVIQRVVAPAKRNGTFVPNAAKVATGGGFPVMGAPFYGGAGLYNTGTSAGRNGINNPPYGSPVGQHRPTNWQAFEALTGGNPWKQLHLLNDNLGGRGQASNLAPGSTSFNGQHLHGAEKPVKDWAGIDAAKTNANQAADYDVTAAYGNPNAVQQEVAQRYDDTFDLNTRRTNAVNAALPGAVQNLVNQRNLYYQTIYPALHFQYTNDFNLYQQQVLLGLLPPYPFSAPPVQPIHPNYYNYVPTVLERANLTNDLFNFFTLQLNNQVTDDKADLQLYVANVFPSSFTCNATFFGEDAITHAVEATAQQTIVVDYQ